MNLDYSKGAIPLYLQIYEILKKQIEQGEYALHERIPSEQELEDRFAVSRMTVRLAISELEKGHYVKKARGKGTTVTYVKVIDEDLSAIRSFTTEMQQRGLVPSTSFVSIVQEEACGEALQFFAMTEGEKAYHLMRVRDANNEPIVLFDTWINPRYDLPLKEEAYRGSMYALFEEKGIGRPQNVKENFQAILADDVLVEYLHCTIGMPILKRTRYTYLEDGTPIEYTQSYYLGDRYSYNVEIGK